MDINLFSYFSINAPTLSTFFPCCKLSILNLTKFICTPSLIHKYYTGHRVLCVFPLPTSLPDCFQYHSHTLWVTHIHTDHTDTQTHTYIHTLHLLSSSSECSSVVTFLGTFSLIFLSRFFYRLTVPRAPCISLLNLLLKYYINLWFLQLSTSLVKN